MGPRIMHLTLATDDDGQSTLFALPPVRKPVGFGDAQKWYPAEGHERGEPVFLRHLCPEMTQLATGRLLDPAHPIRVALLLAPEDEVAVRFGEGLIHVDLKGA